MIWEKLCVSSCLFELKAIMVSTKKGMRTNGRGCAIQTDLLFHEICYAEASRPLTPYTTLFSHSIHSLWHDIRIRSGVHLPHPKCQNGIFLIILWCCILLITRILSFLRLNSTIFLLHGIIVLTVMPSSFLPKSPGESQASSHFEIFLGDTTQRRRELMHACAEQ